MIAEGGLIWHIAKAGGATDEEAEKQVDAARKNFDAYMEMLNTQPVEVTDCDDKGDEK